jgi:integrase
MQEKINIHKIDIEKRKQTITKWNAPECEKIALIRFLNDLELGKVNKGKKISEVRRIKYVDSLKIPLTFFNKDSEELALKDIEKFEIALSSGEIKSNKNKHYSHNTKVDIRRALKIYLRWRIGKEKAEKLTDWLDTRDIIKTPDYLKEQEIEKLFKTCKSSQERFLLAVLFDSGARASEFHNIRFEDIELPKDKDNYVKLTLKEEYSKTKGRTISLYWKHSLDAIRDYLRERELEGIRAEDPVYGKTYDSARLFLTRLGKRVLGRSIYLHLFRHSSATYYASKLNRQQLCYRYGWTFSSNMPDVYISRAGMQDNELDEKFSSTTIEELKSMVEKQQQQNRLIKEKQEELEAELEERKKIDPVLKKILEHVNNLDAIVDKKLILEVTQNQTY